MEKEPQSRAENQETDKPNGALVNLDEELGRLGILIEKVLGPGKTH